MVGPHANATRALIGNYNGQICASGPEDYDCVLTPWMEVKRVNEGGETVMVEGCEDVACGSGELIEEAVKVVQEVDLVVMVVGLDTTVEEESKDRVEIDLPGFQLELIKAVGEVGKPTVVVLMNGGAVAIDELKGRENLAILEAFYPSTQVWYPWGDSSM